MIIHGDNLHALKALMPHYAGKIKCIYIDPPYNTGNEGWCYNDNVNSPLMKEWINKNANPVDKEDMQRHDKWLCMMYPRLKLLHELLADDGVIFVSIDDNELSHLISMMNEIFYENHIGTIPVVNNMKGRNDQHNYAQCHEYLVIFDKGKFLSKGLPLSDKQRKDFKHTDQNGEKYALRDLRKRGGNDTRESRENLYFPMFYNKIKKTFSLKREFPSDVEITPIKKDSADGCWRWGKKKVEDNLSILEASYVPKSDKWNISYRIYLNKLAVNRVETSNDEVEETDDWDDETGEPFERTTKSKSFWWGAEFSTDGAGKLLKQILEDSGKAFDYPKPVSLIKRLIYMAMDTGDIILDSFAGSGTTAHAVLDLNKEDGGNRKFILVEMEDYADTITAERVRRVIGGVPAAKDENLRAGLGGSFTFCELGNEISIEKILTGEALPDYGALASYVFYTATGKSLDGEAVEKPDYFVGETDLYEVYLVYKPDIAFLRGNESALDDLKLKAIAARGSKKEKLVFATAKYRGQKELSAQHITFCQLPYAIHKVVGA
ncbi:site-specific DNA-methyltransferase [Methylovulum psychrotolerans]|uniref:site-specific DNA-methyltransferase n=1 Tax=Methylovulum psychrotolerans TaxID=1704499 RepID=UPI0018DF2355|nr:site-specific DNA-methyltransferase [Methylovulum psychrotolerans]